MQYITCNPDNYASKKTCEYAGGKLLEIAEGNDMHGRGAFKNVSINLLYEKKFYPRNTKFQKE